MDTLNHADEIPVNDPLRNTSESHSFHEPETLNAENDVVTNPQVSMSPAPHPHTRSGHFALPLTLPWRQRYSLDLLFKLQYLESHASDPDLRMPSEQSSDGNSYFLQISKILTEMLLVIEHSMIEEDLNFEFFEKHFPVNGVAQIRRQVVTRPRSGSIGNSKRHSIAASGSTAARRKSVTPQVSTTTVTAPIRTKKDLNQYIFSHHRNLKGKFQNSPNGCEVCGTKYLLNKGYHTCRICLVTICRKGCTKQVPFCEFYSRHEQKNSLPMFSVPVCKRCEEGIRLHHYPVVRNALKHLQHLNEGIALAIENYLDINFRLAEKVDAHVKRNWSIVHDWLVQVKQRVSHETWLYLQWNPTKAVLYSFSSILLIEQQVVCVVFGLAYVLKPEVSAELLKKMAETSTNQPALIPTYFYRDLLGEKQNFRAVKSQLGLLPADSKMVYEPVLAQLISKDWILEELPASAIETIIASTSDMVEKMSNMSTADLRLQAKHITQAMQTYCLNNAPSTDLDQVYVKLEKIDSEEYLFELL